VLRTHLRTIPRLALAVAVGLVAVAALLVGYAKLVGDLVFPRLNAVVADPESTTLATILLMVPIALIALLAALVWAGVATQVASAAVTASRAPLVPAAGRALRRSPRVALAVLIAAIALLLAVLLAPVVVVAGLLGLALRRFAAGRRWPRTSTLVLLAVPFGLAAWLFVRTVLVAPSIWLSGGRLHAAFRDAAGRSRGQEVPMALAVLAAAGLGVGVGYGLSWVTSGLALGDVGATAAQLVALLLVGPLVFVVLAVCYHRGGATPAPATERRAAPARARIATAVVLAMLAPLGITGVVAPAAAVGSEPVSFTISAFSTTPLGTATTFNLVAVRSPSAPPAELPAPTGTVTIEIDDVAVDGGPFELTFGSYDLIHTFTSTGAHTVDATYSGDALYEAATAHFDITVTGSADPVATAVSEFTITPASPSASGAPLSAHVAVDALEGTDQPTGEVWLFLDGDGDPLATGSLAGGAVDLPFSLPPGMHHLYARYQGDVGFQASYLDLTHIVSESLSALGLTSDDATTAAGENIHLTATMTSTPTATGSVSFAALPDSGPAIDLGTSPLDAGVATLDVSTLAVGTYRFVATYAGDGTVAAAESAPLAHTVGKGAVTVEVESDIPAPVFGDTLDLTVQVAAAIDGVGTPTGSVRVLRDGTEVGTGTLISGVAHVSVGTGDAGERTFTAEYAGDATFLTGDGSLDLTVAKRTTETLLTGDDVRSHVYGESQTYEGSVASDDLVTIPTGEVQLWVGGYHVADGVLDGEGRYSITTDLAPVPAVSPTTAWVVYAGDENHEGSQVLPIQRVSLTMTAAHVAPTVGASPDGVLVGEEVTLTATFPDVGAGPTGTVVFDTVDGPLGDTVPVVDGVATLVTTVGQPVTLITAEFTSGDRNFADADSAVFQLTADRGPAIVTLINEDPFVYGDLVDLVATVAIGDATPTAGVTFSGSAEGVLAADVPIISGTARLRVCVGEAAVCPSDGTPRIGPGATSLTASYPEDTTNLAGTSAALPFEVEGAATLTDLVIQGSPSSVAPGDAVTLIATVTPDNPLVELAGSVVFSGVEPGGALAYLGSATIDEHGEARLVDLRVGDGADELRWPAEAIRAEFVPDLTGRFAASTDQVALAIDRIDVHLAVSVGTPTAFGTSTVTVTLTSDAGPDADYLGPVDITADSGDTCRRYVPAGGDQVSCPILWDTVGADGITVEYGGDVIYDLATRDEDVLVGKGTPELGLSVSPSYDVIVNQTVEVQWAPPAPSAGGTVTVWGDGEVWCTDVPVATGVCTGDFGASSATGSEVLIRLQYTGDDVWAGVELEHEVRVANCAVLDVRSTSALGTVTVDTAPNCGGTGYLVGTHVTVTAHPQPGGEFLGWLGYEGGGDLAVVATTLSTTFTLGAGSESWVRVATFRTSCSAITANVTGSGGLFLYPASNCTTADEKPGYLYGTEVSIYPESALNPSYGELDEFYGFGVASYPRTEGLDTFGRFRQLVTVTSPITVPIVFGPRCHGVSVEFAPASAGDAPRVLTPINCSWQKDAGYLRGTVVEVEATPGDPSHVLTGWSVDGTPAPTLGTASRVKVTIGAGDPTVVRASFVSCYTLDVKINAARSQEVGLIGDVVRDVEPNCPDGSARYVAGTVVTLTPEVLREGAVFSSWNSDPRSDERPPSGVTGLVTQSARTISVTENTVVVAGFYYGVACSPLSVYGDVGLVSVSSPVFSDTGGGCGNGYYFDELKYRTFTDGAGQVRDSWRTTLQLTFDPSGPLPTYVSIRGDVTTCFGRNLTTQTGDTTPFGIGRGTVTCDVTGPIVVQVEACQAIVPNPLIHVAGQPAGVRHGWTIPRTMFLPDPDGRIIGIDTSEFSFVETVGVGVSQGTAVYTDLPSGACGDNNVVPPDTGVALFAMAPVGFEFQGWAEYDTPDPASNPDGRRTTRDAPTMTASPLYEVKCFTVTLDAGITLEGEPARCPGSSVDDNSYVAGTAVQVRAQQTYNGRILTGFRSGVVANQVYEDPVTLDLIGYAYVDRDLHVQADYPSSAESTARGVAQGLKITSGLFAIMAPILFSAAFPPAGILFSVLGAGAGLASLAGQDDIAAVFDLINPTKITMCAARWAWGTSDDPTGSYNLGKIVTTGNKLVKLLRGQPIVDPNASNAGTLGGGMAGFLLGLYTNQVWNADFTPQTIEQLRDTETMTGCLDDQWRAAGSNLTGG
jgi:hypothetical protein